MQDDWTEAVLPDDDQPLTQPTRENERDAILFMIDSQPSMFEPNAEGQIPFDVAVQCCIRFYKDKVMSSDSDFVGLLLYSTKHRLNAYDFDGIYIFHTLARPSAQRIKELENLIVNKAGFQQHVGMNDAFYVSDALWASQHLFHGLPKTVGYKRIFVFTNDDNPGKGDPVLREKCVARARDLVEAEVVLQLFAIKKGLPHEQASTSPPRSNLRHASGSGSDDFVASDPLRFYNTTGGSVSLSPHVSTSLGHGASLSPHPKGSTNVSKSVISSADPASFDAAIFWRDLMYVEEEAGQAKAIHLNAHTSFSDLLEPLRRKTHSRRSVGQLRVAFGTASLDTPSMGVKVFNTLMKETKGATVRLDAKTNAPLTSNTQYICKTTAEVLAAEDRERVMGVGGRAVYFSQAEITQIRSTVSSQPGIRILGFKPRDTLKDSHQIEKPFFLRPDETSVLGSTRAFQALVMKMHEMNKIAIAQVTPRKASQPRLVAFLPQLQTYLPDGSVDEHFGMHGILLPFADDVRGVELGKVAEQPEGHTRLVSKAKQIIKKMQLQPAYDGTQPCYDPQDYPNPALQKHFTVLQSIALEEDYDPVPDYTLPDYQGMASFAKLFGQYNDLSQEVQYAPEVIAASGSRAFIGGKSPTKRKRDDDGAGPAAKARMVWC